jgi:tetratricopeptide (TPR) repeat protein
MKTNKTCFVLMGFGEKTDYRTQRKLNLEKTYNIIRGALKESGYQCIRADDVVHAGVIDKPMYELLLGADIAIADLSTCNENAIYELGVRHALRPHTTIVIAEKQFSFPFDLNHVVIRPYEHLGTGIDYEEADRLKLELKKVILELTGKSETDSPVYTFLPGLTPPALGDTQNVADETGMAAATPGAAAATTAGSRQLPDDTFSILLDAFHQCRAGDDFISAKAQVERLLELLPSDSYLIQQHALVTYKSKSPDMISALNEAKKILEEGLDPQHSNDPETLGIWGSIHKQLWEQQQKRSDLDEAIAAYERGFYLRRDYYTGVNYAFLLNVRAPLQQDVDEAVADKVIARRTRRQVLRIVEQTLASIPRNKQGEAADPHEAYWLGATRLEALLGLGVTELLEQAKTELYQNAPEPWMQATTEQQLNKLQAPLDVD